MYTQFFKLATDPFSIAPDPRFLYMSERHREALAHLLYGVSGGGGFVLLTGEVGAGKTTVCRCFLEQIPADCNVGYIFNPKLSVDELLKSICEEFHIALPEGSVGIKASVDALNAFLLREHAAGRHNVLIIDEAQGLSAAVLEQLRLLTNLETNERKLLQIILIGQPELRALLERTDLRQLAQRVIARYHLDSLSPAETASYIAHRLAVAGIAGPSPLPEGLTKTIHRLTDGVPRRINLLCDRALLGAYAEGKGTVTRKILLKAAGEVFGEAPAQPGVVRRLLPPTALGIAVVAAAAWAYTVHEQPMSSKLAPAPAPKPVVKAAPPAVKPAAPKPLPVFDPAGTIPEQADLDHAYHDLAARWGRSFDEGDACNVLQQAGLRCYQSSKGFAEIRQLNRPAILFLRDAQNRPYYALLTSLNDNEATLQIGAERYHASVLGLMPYFHGEFATVWHTPPEYREKIRNGDQGTDIDWIAAQLARLDGAAAPAPGAHYDAALTQQVRSFQAAQGLSPDGVAGPKTVMLLSRATDGTEPRLSGTTTTK
ncbi:MAG: AAA family ATPase [Burkholderiaceae bacterium]|nr:AAA family ATPase [Burkholderiaceae bacterium]